MKFGKDRRKRRKIKFKLYEIKLPKISRGFQGEARTESRAGACLSI